MLTNASTRGRRAGRWMLAAVAVLAVGLPPSAARAEVEPAADEATIIIAGDIATCTGSGDAQTAALVETIPGIVMTAGDNAYPRGSGAQCRDCYGPTWGRFRARTRPALGNHDWATAGAAGYFDYFGSRAGPGRRGWYAFNAGTWRIYVLDSMLCFIGTRQESGCTRGSPQYGWLANDLQEHPRACVMAVMHHPRFSSGPHGNTVRTRPLLGLLYRAGAEIVVNGHDHVYERFARARPDGAPDDASGLRQFIVGTGGGGLYGLDDVAAPNSEVRDNSSYGVLRLRLGSDGYSWRFRRVRGAGGDRGAELCHGEPTAGAVAPTVERPAVASWRRTAGAFRGE